MRTKLRSFVSKKLFATVATAVLTFVLVRVNALLLVPIPNDTLVSVIAWLVALTSAYVLGQSAVDVATTINNKK